jgi:hypothetical protein
MKKTFWANEFSERLYKAEVYAPKQVNLGHLILEVI